ncbi:MAG: hypothetical protein IT293_21060 [Deltaproteobacteria bacterium]|nr:hypothetical protein [Deltaproteobacteria bacterium]
MRTDLNGFMTMVALCAALVVAVSASVADDAPGSVTLSGDIVCAKCTLKVAGLDHCQNVLLVEDGSEPKQFWLAANDVNEKFGDVCTAKRPVAVTGIVQTKDGKPWLTPIRIEARAAP